MPEKKSRISRFIDGVNHLIRSFKNFVKASFLSLVIILIILLLLTQMDQAFTMMVDLVENTKFSLFLAFLFINGLAIVLSHFPIYTYYAADLNNSGNYTNWKKVFPLTIWPFKRFPVFVFTTNKDTDYTPDNWANYLRYSIGLLIHIVWIHFIISSFAPNLIFENFPLLPVKIIIYTLLIVPFILYIIQKEKFTSLTATETKDGIPLTEDQKRVNGAKLNRLYKKLGVWYFVIAISSGLLLFLMLFIGNFSPGGFILILLTSYLFVFNYVFFRLLRTRLSQVSSTLQHSLLAPVRFFFRRIHFLQKSENYILLFNVHFIISIILLVYSTLASINGWSLSNGIPILLAFFYFYYFIIASLGKYFFVTKKMNLFGTRKYRILFGSATVIVILLFITNCANVEVRTHELDLVENTKTEVLESQFLDSVAAKNDNTLFFIASHGGGLKANVWTLNVLNRLQQRTEGKLLNQTIAMSGASGGSLGLALYTGLYKENGIDTLLIKQQIDKIAQENYTSLDLTLTFGLDSYRKIWPLSQRIGLRDRPYYAMVKYQKNVENTSEKTLSETSFRDYWKEAFQSTGYFPSLIMNTAGTTGSRGILWSVKPNKFNAIFPYSKNLADLYDDTKTIPFYQAVSTTNRFPVFSPAAKIPGYGHYIDAGAIDNSGLLGCLDLHIYLLNDSRKVLGDKQVAYVEIINSKSLYVNYLINKFKEEQQIDHILKNENESDNIVVDLKTGLNLDKIPGYLSDYITNWENTQNGKIRYFKIFMPHKVSFEDVEAFFDGKIENGDNNVVSDLKAFLDKKNNEILNLTEAPNKSFFDPWEFYEPTLSRHLSKSSLNYIDHILKHPLLDEQFLEIEKLINTKRIEKNENPEMAF
ncbi:MAG: patatin-like phospholipase family protein [Altibacter sp.]|uniref:patatin-like phospholipase family protein n=1 Tax=Altibacter sp. TaxID=2024823 RepID=UPI001DFD4C68|nr:patatin-like phospholipase family protein [Altibacter sp.]MBZ0328209.1 patatin-like phospholipase family protein [Altibacter sp.]